MTTAFKLQTYGELDVVSNLVPPAIWGVHAEMTKCQNLPSRLPCPYCREPIIIGARRCRYCETDLNDAPGWMTTNGVVNRQTPSSVPQAISAEPSKERESDRSKVALRLTPTASVTISPSRPVIEQPALTYSADSIAKTSIQPPPLQEEQAGPGSIPAGIARGLKNYAVFTGRATRMEFWSLLLFITLLVVSLPILIGIATALGVPSNILGLLLVSSELAMILPIISAAVRRLHDVDRSGWLLLIVFTAVGAFPVLYWLIRKSDDRLNGFGPPQNMP